MNVVVVVAAFVTVVGALVAVTTRDARTAIGGLVAALAAAALVADPLPGFAAVAVRAVAALLGGYLLFVVIGRTSRSPRESLVGAPATALAAAAAFVIGFGADDLASSPVGPPLALGAGLALVAISAAPVARAADALRLGIGLATLVTGAELVRVGLAGTPAPLEQLLIAGLTVALLVTTAVLGAAAIATTEGLSLREEPRPDGRYEAHPLTAATPPARRERSWRARRPTRPGRFARAPQATRSDDPADPDAARPRPDAAAEPMPEPPPEPTPDPVADPMAEPPRGSVEPPPGSGGPG